MADFAKLVLSAETGSLNKAGQDLDKLGAKAGDVARQVSAKMTSLGKGLTIGVTAPLTLFGKGAVQAAIDAQELQSMFDTTFGSMSGTMNKWAEETGNAMGRSTQELQQGAAMFQGFFKDMLPEAEAAEFSKTLTVLAQDVASFKNLSNEDSQRRLFAAVTGEYESLKALGVVINDNVMAAKAMEMGFGGSTSALTEQEKVLVRTALLQEKFADASGDVIKTSGSMANQIKEAQAKFSELQVEVGSKLIPVLTPLLEKLGAALDWFTALPEPVQETAVVIAGVAAAAGPLLLVVGQLTTAVPLLMKAMTFLFAHPVILGAAALIGGIYLAWKNWDKITAIVASVYQGVKTWMMDKLGAVMDWVKKKVEMVEGAFRWLWDRVVGNSWVPDMVTGVASEFAKLEGVMVNPALSAVGKVNTAFASLPSAGGIFAGMSPGLLPIDTLEKLGMAANDNAAETETATMRIEKSFEEMANTAIGAVDRMAKAIKGGGILDILSAVIGLGTQLGSIGVFGKEIATNINSSRPGFGGYRANGGPVSAGKAYMVGERGPELIVPGSNSRVVPNEAIGGGKFQIEIVANNNGFGAIMRDEAGKVVAQAAPYIANAGSSAVLAVQARSGKRSMS